MPHKTKTYGLIGKKLSHSFSQRFFLEKFKRENIAAQYLNFELESIGEFKNLISNHSELKGLNVTIPYKEAVIDFLDELSPDAREIGAVNTIQFKAGQLIGHNTDVIGFEKSLKLLLEKQHNQALVLGTGGAAKAVTYVLRKLNIEYQFISRKSSNNAISYEDLTKDLVSKHKLIINTTPLGMSPKMDALPTLPYSVIGKNHLLYDLIYNPTETLFLKQGKQQGAKTKNGLEMLQLQALAAWGIWKG